MTEELRQALIKEIIELELKMFQAVNSRGGTASCQETPESFRLMRHMTHYVLPANFLKSYKNDLTQAAIDNRNLMTEKYALMEGLIPDLNTSPDIARIVEIESNWRKEVAKQFPLSVHPEGHDNFCTYLKGELQTYSPKTLNIYLDYAEKKQKEQGNLVRERYEILMRNMGYQSLTHCEKSQAKRAS